MAIEIGVKRVRGEEKGSVVVPKALRIDPMLASFTEGAEYLSGDAKVHMLALANFSPPFEAPSLPKIIEEICLLRKSPIPFTAIHAIVPGIDAMIEELKKMEKTTQVCVVGRLLSELHAVDKYARVAEKMPTGSWKELPASPMLHEVVTRHFGHLRKDKLLGDGSFGKVFSTKNDTFLAVKEIVSTCSRDLLELELVVSQLVKSKAAGIFLVTGEDRHFYLMKRVLAENLDKYEPRGTSFSASEIRTIASDVLPDLNELHKNGFVFCDVKPSNIVLGDSGATLLDYGFVAVKGERVTRGTRHFASPEHARAFDDSELFRAHPSWDCWSLGMSLLELSIGDHSLSDLCVDSKLRSDSSAFTARLQTYIEKASLSSNPTLVTLIQGLLTLDPKKRMTAEEAMRLLKEDE